MNNIALFFCFNWLLAASAEEAALGRAGRAAGADPRLLPGTDALVTPDGHRSRQLHPTVFQRKRLEVHQAGLALALTLQGGNGLDKLCCFHPDCFSFKASASVGLIMEMVSPASQPSPPLLLVLGLSHCFQSARCGTLCCCVPGRASRSGGTTGGTRSSREEQQHPAIPHRHPLSHSDSPSGGGGPSS